MGNDRMKVKQGRSYTVKDVDTEAETVLITVTVRTRTGETKEYKGEYRCFERYKSSVRIWYACGHAIIHTFPDNAKLEDKIPEYGKMHCLSCLSGLDLPELEGSDAQIEWARSIQVRRWFEICSVFGGSEIIRNNPVLLREVRRMFWDSLASRWIEDRNIETAELLYGEIKEHGEG